MRCSSTRNSNLKASSREAILKGISEDGELFVPESFPEFDILDHLDLSYTQLCHAVLSLYLTDFDSGELLEIIERSYVSFKEDIYKIAYHKDYYLELYHGRTSAFKGFVLCLPPNLMIYAKKSLGISEKTLILTATSGGIGKAALEEFYSTENIDILVLYPTEEVSGIQKAQMDTTSSLDSKVVSIDGNFNDAQTAVKRTFNDKDIKEESKNQNIYLSSANSINIGRLLPQIVYYFYVCQDLVNNKKISAGEEIPFCVPTGNFGDILAGYYAKEMRLPIERLVITSNDNNVLTDFFTTGAYDANKDLVKTISPSMDILASLNLERLICHKSSDETVKQKMTELNKSKIFTFEGDLHELKCGYTTENETRDTIKEVFEDEGYLIDTHTAVAKNITDKLGLDKTVILSTASPYKLSSTVLKALGENISSDEFENIDLLYEKTGAKTPKEIKKSHSKKIIHKTRITKNKIEDGVLKFARRGKRISVPTTSADIGPGFGVPGAALDSAGTCGFKLTDDENTFEKNVESNLIYKSYKYTLDFYREKIVPVEFDPDTNIPMSQGLGSSAACIVMGIVAALSVTGKDPDEEEILKIVTQIGGHPDNVAPAIFADTIASILKDDEVFVEKFKISGKLKFLAAIPDFELSIQRAREVLPGNYIKNDAVFNVSRISMLVLSLISGNKDNLKIALKDKIQEPYRLQLIPEAEKIDEIIESSDVIGHYLSGAGSTIMVILKSNDTTSESEIRDKLNNLSSPYEVMRLDIGKRGAFIA